MSREHDIEQEQRGGPPAPPSPHPQDAVQEVSGPPLEVFPHPPQRPPRPPRNPWVVIGALALALALIVSLGVLLIPGLLQRPAAPTPVPTTPGKTVTPAPAVTSTTVPMPTTQTSCPPAGTARGAVMAPLALGSHANVVYMQDQWEGTNPTAGILKRYDTTTGNTTVIATVPAIDEAQVSADGQWVLFTSTISFRSSSIQLVRMDGQGLQTLYCSSSGEPVWGLQWSPDQKYLAFKDGFQNVYLLTVATGAYRLEVPPSNTTWYVPRTWLDNTHLYLTPYSAIGGPSPLEVSLLDISTGKVQQVLASPALYGDFDSSIDGTQVYSQVYSIEYVIGEPVMKGPSSIRVQPATGGPARVIYSTPTDVIRALRVVSRTSLLFVIHNTGVNVDSSHNGLWKINTDGTGLSRLTTETAEEETTFNHYTQYIWSTVSPDGKSYAVQISKYTSSSPGTISLLIGSMNGGSPIAIATQPYTDQVPLVGWTSM